MVSPWVLRVAMPSVAMAGTAAYIGYKVWEHVQQQQRVRVSTNSDEEDAELQEALQLSLLLSQQQEKESTTDDANDSDEWRRALCQSLELPNDTALNDISSESMLQVCVECLAELPVAVRMAFVQWVVTNQSLSSRSTEQQQQHLEQQLLVLHSLIVSLPIRRNRSEEGEDNSDGNEMTHEDDFNSRQVLVLLLTQVPSLQQDVFLQALDVCPDRPRWLNLLYRLWLHQDTHQPQQEQQQEEEDTDTESPFQDEHDAATERQGHTLEEDTQEDDCPTTSVATTNPGWTLLLEQLQRRYTTQGTAALYQLVQAILALVPQESSNPNQEEFLVTLPTLFHILQRLEPQLQMDHFDDNEDTDSVLSSWSRPGHDAVGGCVRGVGLCSGAPDQATRLVWKLHSLSTDRLRSVALSFAVFDNDQISELIDTLLQSQPHNDKNNSNTSSQSGIWL